MSSATRLFMVVVLILAVQSQGQTRARRPARRHAASRPARVVVSPPAASQPASAPSTRPAALDARIPPEKYRQYLEEVKKVQQDRHPDIQTLRRSIQERAREEQIDYKRMQEASSDKAQIAIYHARIARRRGHPHRALRHRGQAEKAERNARARMEDLELREAGYVKVLHELNRLEAAWRACCEHAVHVRYQQLRKARTAEDTAEEMLERADWHDYPTQFDIRIRPIRRAIQSQFDARPQ